MIILQSNEVEGYLTPEPEQRVLKVLISPNQQEEVQGLSVGMTILEPGKSSSWHSHDVACETWIIVAGHGDVQIGEERRPVGPETVVFIPPKVNHQIDNTGKETLRMFWIYTPPGAEKAVLEMTQR